MDDNQKQHRIHEVHSLCEQFKYVLLGYWVIVNRTSKIAFQNKHIAKELPLNCMEQPILEELESIESFEKKNLCYKFWKSMFGTSYPTSWWTQFKTLISRNIRVMIRDPRLTVARFFQTIVLSVLIGLVFMQLSLEQSVSSFISFHCRVLQIVFP